MPDAPHQSPEARSLDDGAVDLGIQLDDVGATGF
jgi:hypothetical protein